MEWLPSSDGGKPPAVTPPGRFGAEPGRRRRGTARATAQPLVLVWRQGVLRH